MTDRRPLVSVVVPFGGGNPQRVRASLLALDLTDGDEVIVADNSPGGDASALAEVARVVPATGERSSYHARNRGAQAASGHWLLFIDADCRPEAQLLRSFFEPPPAKGTGAVAGEILGEPEQPALAARYARDRKVLSQTDGHYGRGRAIAATGNLMVRAIAFRKLGGFIEGIRSGGDVDFCLRLQEAGWALEFRPEAVVRHAHRDTVTGLLLAFARYGSGSRWLHERYPAVGRRWPLSVRELVRVGGDAARHGLRGEREAAAFRLIDGAGLLAHNAGWAASNRAR